MNGQQHVLPTGEEHLHVPFVGCSCEPRVKRFSNGTVIFHKAFDKRYVWLAVEMLLGITCYEHCLFVDSTYEKGKDHEHVPKPKPYFEYGHKKIDPR